jgi:uncharacterized membrane protein
VPAVASATHVAVTGEAAAPAAATRATPRLESVDLLRGLVMILMALDHVRDRLHASAFAYDPTDLSRASAAVFLTRWVTHFCAPVFVFLAGAGAFIWGSRGRTRAELSRYLLTRGLWLIALETTVINTAWQFHPTFQVIILQVIWATGWSMIALAALVHMPLPAIGAFGWWMILGHNLFDGVKSERLGWFAPVWNVLHVQGPVPVAPGVTLAVIYPLVPWIGVMAAGYAFGSWLTSDHPKRDRRIIAIGLLLIMVFAELRTYNFYGDPHHWSAQKNALFSALSFINCTKYPPSLLYLCMTLGPALVLLGVLGSGVPGWCRPLVVFGRVPLFYYILHLYLIDVITIGFAIARYGRNLPAIMANGPPPGYGWGLGVIYAVWIAVVLALYPVCRWYAGVKATRRSRWLSYL